MLRPACSRSAFQVTIAASSPCSSAGSALMLGSTSMRTVVGESGVPFWIRPPFLSLLGSSGPDVGQSPFFTATNAAGPVTSTPRAWVAARSESSQWPSTRFGVLRSSVSGLEIGPKVPPAPAPLTVPAKPVTADQTGALAGPLNAQLLTVRAPLTS